VSTVRLGLRANAAQFSLLVGLNTLVGALVGLERSVLPLVGERDFQLSSHAAILAFVVAFGAAKALTNLGAGALADRVGRKRLLVLGWLLALPVAPLIAFAPGWWLVVAANVLLGANQGLAWSMTVVMKIDLAGPARRGLALGLNESAGYLGVAVTAFASGALAASVAPRTVVWAGALAIALAGTLIALVFVRDTGAHVGHCGLPSPRRASAGRSCVPARRRGWSTTSMTRSPGGWRRSTSRPTAPTPRGSARSRRSTRASGGSSSSQPAGSPMWPAANR
jgi:MFS family permease